MKVSKIAISFCVAVALLAGCAHQDGTTALPNAGSLAHSQPPPADFRVIYDFQGSQDGGYPTGRLVALDSILYGTTSGFGVNGEGTVFSVTPAGTESVLYSFGGGSDGQTPVGGLTLHDGTFYGTTSKGGAYRNGAVFAYHKAGYEGVLWSFPHSSDARGSVSFDSGILYGTTQRGGDADAGSVFAVKLNPNSGSTLYSFKGLPADGSEPTTGLETLNSKLYGTTLQGGSGPCTHKVANKRVKVGCGTVFRIAPSGNEEVIYSFKGTERDGAEPRGDLTLLDGKLYGVTQSSGKYGFGTVYEVKEDGTERIVHDFAQNDGAYPRAGLVAFKGLLYGTTSSYGGKGHQGSIFELNPNGAFRALHGLVDRDGVDPESSLAELNGELYGTTRTGGAHRLGTVYEVTP